tara:strand:+ start:9572 stop:9742 length:171 start_codon:yes stop_codon:yes gene_type:complete
MDAKTKKYLMIGGALVLAYLLYKKYGNKMGLTKSKGSGTSSFVANEELFHDTAFND